MLRRPFLWVLLIVPISFCEDMGYNRRNDRGRGKERRELVLSTDSIRPEQSRLVIFPAP